MKQIKIVIATLVIVGGPWAFVLSMDQTMALIEHVYRDSCLNLVPATYASTNSSRCIAGMGERGDSIKAAVILFASFTVTLTAIWLMALLFLRDIVKKVFPGVDRLGRIMLAAICLGLMTLALNATGDLIIPTDDGKIRFTLQALTMISWFCLIGIIARMRKP